MPEHTQEKEQKSQAAATQHPASSSSEMQGLDVGLQQGLIQRVLANPHTLSATNIVYLQRSIGNRAVSQLLGRDRTAKPLQRNSISGLHVGPVDDAYEREAHQVADQVAGHTSVQRSTASQSVPAASSHVSRIQRVDDPNAKYHRKNKQLDNKLDRAKSFKTMAKAGQSMLGSVAKPAARIADQASVLDLHAKDFAKFAATGKTRGERLRPAYPIPNSRYDKGTDKRKQGRFGIGKSVDTATSEQGLKGFDKSIAAVEDKKFAKKYEGKQAFDVLGTNPGGNASINQTMRDPLNDWAELGQGDFASLTKAERLAIRSYTSENYKYINPAMAENKGWLQSQMARIHGQIRLGDASVKPEELENAYKTGKEAGKFTASGLNKLPIWKQDQTIYRGETVTEEEGLGMVKGATKKYPHFVSTSLEKTTPESQIREFKTKERPYQLLYHIVDSQSGRDLGKLSMHTREHEILFPANTTFTVTDVLSEDKEDKKKELEVAQS